jgi:hypothetical protein
VQVGNHLAGQYKRRGHLQPYEYRGTKVSAELPAWKELRAIVGHRTTCVLDTGRTDVPERVAVWGDLQTGLIYSGAQSARALSVTFDGGA